VAPPDKRGFISREECLILTPWSDFPVWENQRTADLEELGGRESHLHLSDLIHQMKVARGDKVGPIPGDQDRMRMQEGFIWESALEYMIGGMSLDDAIELAFKRYMLAVRSDVCTQLRLEKDGIRMTPDGYNEKDGELESYKCTRKSLRRAVEDFPNNFWDWFVQERSYAYALGVDTVTWIVLFQGGDYSKGMGTGPRAMQCTATFTPEELVENWREVLAEKEAMSV